MKLHSGFGNTISHVFMYLIICIVTFAFLALCNWSYNMGDWNGFSRFILGAVGVFSIIDFSYKI